MFTTRDAIIRQLTSEADPFKNEKKRKDLSETMSVMSKRRAYTGIEPVTSRTLSENHTTRPAGLQFPFSLSPFHKDIHQTMIDRLFFECERITSLHKHAK